MNADRQTYTHKQTDMLITILCSPIGGGVRAIITKLDARQSPMITHPAAPLLPVSSKSVL